MRETRYAVEALAEAYPRPSGPLRSWGNRDGQAARLPRTDSLLHTLDDLDNLWDVPARRPPELRPGHPPPPRPPRRRSSGPTPRPAWGGSATPRPSRPWSPTSATPSKVAWRGAAWALRQLGNDGIGVDAIREALTSPDPATRRGATRIFAYQFDGMDARVDLADALIARAADPDLWARLQAVRSLRQWFYRTGDDRLKAEDRRRLPRPDGRARSSRSSARRWSRGCTSSSTRTSAAGSASQRNLAGSSPNGSAGGRSEGREAVERDVLLGPILAALASGNSLQREALVASFDGSFFAGRRFARRPTGMIDVGNDREFGFLYEPPADLLDRTFAALLEPGPRSQGAARGDPPGQLLPGRRPVGRPRDPDGPAPGDGRPRRRGPRGRPGRGRRRPRLDRRRGRPGAGRADPRRSWRPEPRTGGRSRRPSLASPALADHPAIRRRRPGDPRPRRCGVAARPAPPGPPARRRRGPRGRSAAAWAVATAPPDRLALLDALLARPALVDRDEPSADAVDLLRLAVRRPGGLDPRADPGSPGRSPPVPPREGRPGALARPASPTTALRSGGPAWTWPTPTPPSGPGPTPPSASSPSWSTPTPPSGPAPSGPSSGTAWRPATRRSPAGSRRSRPTPPSATGPSPRSATRGTTRRRRRRPRPGPAPPPQPGDVPRPDQPAVLPAGRGWDVSCARCHATHSVLRIAEGGVGDPEALIANYQSALKAINPGDPEASLLLRKPRSPQGRPSGTR